MKLDRYDGEVPIFSENYEGRERTIFGSATESNNINDQFTPEFMRGWGIVGDTEFPTLQDFNALGYTHGKLISYLYQAGIPSYTANEKYYPGSIVQYNNDIYLCTATEPTSLPTNTRDWVKWQSSLGELAQIRADKNGFLLNKAGTYNALIDTDMSQSVIDNDDLTVTSGAVYRALLPKRDLSDTVFSSALNVNRQDITTGDLWNANRLNGREFITVFRSTGGLSFRVRANSADGRKLTDIDRFWDFPSKSGVIALLSDILGVGQKWVDVTRQRVADTTYTNNTGKPIDVAVTFRQSDGNNAAEHTFIVDGLNVGRNVTRYGQGEKASFTSAVVPSGSSYSVKDAQGTLFVWAELR